MTLSKNFTSIAEAKKPHMLKPETLAYLQKEAENFGIKKMMLFGSCLYKPEDEAGDIDLAVEGIKKRTLYRFLGTLLLSDELKKQVDVVDLSDNTPIISIILDEGVTIYQQSLAKTRSF